MMDMDEPELLLWSGELTTVRDLTYTIWFLELSNLYSPDLVRRLSFACIGFGDFEVTEEDRRAANVLDRNGDIGRSLLMGEFPHKYTGIIRECTVPGFQRVIAPLVCPLRRPASLFQPWRGN